MCRKTACFSDRECRSDRKNSMNHLYLSVYCFQCKKRILHDAPATADRDLEFIIGIKVGRISECLPVCTLPRWCGDAWEFQKYNVCSSWKPASVDQYFGRHKSRTDSEVSELSWTRQSLRRVQGLLLRCWLHEMHSSSGGLVRSMPRSEPERG